MPDLVRAVFAGDLKAVHNVLREGGDINEVDESGRTALMHAATAKRPDILRALLEYQANPNIQDANGWTALHFAAQEQASEVVRQLLTHGADPNIPDEYGNTPLFRAVFSYRDDSGDTIQILLTFGSDPDRENERGISPRKLAMTIANYGSRVFFDHPTRHS